MLETLRDQERQLRENGESLARDERKQAMGGNDVKQLEEIIEAQEEAIQDQLRTIEEQSSIIDELQRQLKSEGFTPTVYPEHPTMHDRTPIGAATLGGSAGFTGIRSSTPTRAMPDSGSVSRRTSSGAQ